MKTLAYRLAILAIAVTFISNLPGGVFLNAHGSASYWLSGTVIDAAAGWPIYAIITIETVPATTPTQIRTDPATGAFSIELKAGSSFRVNVRAWGPGYQELSRFIDLLTEDASIAFELPYSPDRQAAPGYQFYLQTFDQVTPPVLPDGWVFQPASGFSGSWTTTNAKPNGFLPHGLPGMLRYNARSGDQARLSETAGVDLSNTQAAFLSFWMLHDTERTQSDHLQVQASTDSGATWQDIGAKIDRYDGAPTGWYEHRIDLSSLIESGAMNLRLGLMGVSAGGNDLYLDDLVLAIPQSGALVTGRVTSFRTGEGLLGATVRCQDGSTFTTQAVDGDPSEEQGRFIVFCPEGAHQIEASQDGYGGYRSLLTITPGDNQALDLVLPPMIELESDDLTIILPPGANTSRNVYLSNRSLTQALDWAVKENQDLPWLNAAPSNGTLGEGETQITELHFDTSGLALGQYQSSLEVLSSDPEYPKLSLPITLTVSPSYDLDAAPLGIQEGWPGAELAFSLSVTNTGALTDTYTASVKAGAWPVQVISKTGPVAPGEKVGVPVLVTIPITSTGEISTDRLEVTFCSQQQPERCDTSVVMANLLGPAEANLSASLTPVKINTSLGETVTHTLTITNHGPYVAWDVSVVLWLPPETTIEWGSLDKGSKSWQQDGRQAQIDLGDLWPGITHSVSLVFYPQRPGQNNLEWWLLHADDYGSQSDKTGWAAIYVQETRLYLPLTRRP